MTMELSVIGINHRTAPVAVRELFALPRELSRRLLRAVRSEEVFEEALVLDTCNRTEVYFVARERQDHLAYLLAHIGKLKDAVPTVEDSVFYRHDGLGAVAHLFRVAASLDSQIVGEHQILGQIRDAYRQALEARTAGFVLNKLLHFAFRVGKRTMSQTDLGRGSTSVPQAAVELARQVFSSLAGKTVLLVGAGRTAELAARALVRCGAGRLVVANRTIERARELARNLLQRRSEKSPAADPVCDKAPEEDDVSCPALLRAGKNAASSDSSPMTRAGPPTVDAVGLDALADVIAGADLVICSTGSQRFVLTLDGVGDVLRRKDHAVLVIDIAVPRDVDPRLGRLSNVFLYDIDDLDRVVARNIERRRREIPHAEAIVDHEVKEFSSWLDSRQAAPTIRLLRERFDILRRAQIKRYGTKFASSDRGELDRFTQGLCSKILHDPLTFLRELSEDNLSSEALAAIDVIRRMFDLDSLEQTR